MTSINEYFKVFIKKLLSKGNIEETHLNNLVSDNNMKLFLQSFTSKTKFPTKPKYNYEVYEQRGDLTINKFIVNYMYNRFPQLNCPLCVQIVARLRIKYGSKEQLAIIAERLGFWEFIEADDNEKDSNKTHLLEDVFEAFFGVTEKILDDTFRIGVGYSICYTILEDIFDPISISLEYYDLFDSNTILKELFDKNTQLKNKFKTVYLHNNSSKTCTITVQKTSSNTDTTSIFSLYEIIGTGKGNTKNIAEQATSKIALKYLKEKKNIEPVISEIYRIFCDFP